ncbi:MAG: hypothetical protein ABH969_10055 [Pseudomonadota bacterium]
MKKRAAGVVRAAGRSIDKTKPRDPQAEFADFVGIIEAAKKTNERIKKLILAEKKNLDRAGEIRERNEKLWTKEHWKKISALHRRGAGSEKESLILTAGNS